MARLSLPIMEAVALAQVHYGSNAKIRPQWSAEHALWVVVLPPNPQRGLVAAAFEAAGVLVLAEIRPA
jgi:hypothetical protein